MTQANKMRNKSVLLVVSIVLLLCVTIGGTIAFLIDSTEEVKNTFTPSKVTTEIIEDTTTVPGTKQDVKIKNTGDTEAYIRAVVIITWQNEAGNVYGTVPVECKTVDCTHVDCGGDYTVAWNLKKDDSVTGWVKGSDGFYYYSVPVAAEGISEALISSIKPTNATNSNLPEGYYLNVEIIASGIQSKPIDVVKDSWGVESNTKTVDDTTITVISKN